MSEVWRLIPGLDGVHEVSNLGNVRVLPRMINRIRNGKQQSFIKKGIELTKVIEGCGYHQVLITTNTFKRNMKVHRLVALAFLENHENKKCVNHINGVKTDNHVENLEWVTHSENIKHAHKTGLKKPPSLGKFGDQHHRSKRVLTVKDCAIIEHGSYAECARYLKVDATSIRLAIIKNYRCKGHQVYAI
jgi:hypothetical protein